jgi:hypothetical protein
MVLSFPLSNGVSNGFIKYLVNSKKSQTHAKSTASGQYYEKYPPSNIANGKKFYTEKNSSFGQWILIELKRNKMRFEGYSIVGNVQYEAPSNWRIEVSPDSEYWSVADEQNNQNTFNPGSIYQTNAFNNVRFIKFIQTGLSGVPPSTRNYSYIHRFDIFGTVYYIDNYYCTKPLSCSSSPFAFLCAVSFLLS